MDQEALSEGLQVKFYYSSIRVYTEAKFVKELDIKGQEPYLGDFGAHHQNGGSEESIKTVA